MPQSENELRSMAESLALGLALEDALSGLVQVHGMGYLDTFLERRLRRTVGELRKVATMAPAPSEMTALMDQQASYAEAVLRRTVEAVKKDPSPVA